MRGKSEEEREGKGQEEDRGMSMLNECWKRKTRKG